MVTVLCKLLTIVIVRWENQILAKIDAIKEMKLPSTKQDLQSFLGMVNYLSSYIPHMSEPTSYCRNILIDSLFLMDRDTRNLSSSC